MKKLFFVLCCVWMSFQLNAATGSPMSVVENGTIELAADFVSVDLVAAELIDAVDAVACAIVPVTTSCGNTYNTQYCDEGLHGDNVFEWAQQVDSWDCD